MIPKKYIILSKGCPFGEGDTIQGYVTSKLFAETLCEKFNNQCRVERLEEDYYFIETDESSSLYLVNLCLDHYINCI